MKSRCQIELSRFYEHVPFRKMRWRQYVNAKRSEPLLMDRIEMTFGKDVVLAYENWSRKSSMKHFMSQSEEDYEKCHANVLKSLV